MKKIAFTLFVSFLTLAGWAQSEKLPVMTTAFSDSLKKQINNIIPRDYTIKLSYQSIISSEGKLLKPLITHEVANCTVEDNDFVQKLRVLIKNAPAWKPVTNNSSDTVAAGVVLFDIEIVNSRISITDKTQ